jgi:hypothetical protein
MPEYDAFDTRFIKEVPCDYMENKQFTQNPQSL